MDDESENRGEKYYRFSQSSEKQYAIREIESTLEDAKNNAAFIKTHKVQLGMIGSSVSSAKRAGKNLTVATCTG